MYACGCTVHAMKNFEQSLRPGSRHRVLSDRESGFTLRPRTCCSASAYCSLRDPYMREYWHSPFNRERLVDFRLLYPNSSRLVQAKLDDYQISLHTKREMEERRRYYLGCAKRLQSLVLERAWLSRRIVREIVSRDIRSARV